MPNTAGRKRQTQTIRTIVSIPNQTSFFAAFRPAACGSRESLVDANKPSKVKIDVSELEAKYAALEIEIRLLRELRTQVTKKLRKQVQLQVRQSPAVRNRHKTGGAAGKRTSGTKSVRHGRTKGVAREPY